MHYYDVFHRRLSTYRLTNEIIPALDEAGFIIEAYNPNNRREKMVYPIYTSEVCTTQNGTSNNIYEQGLTIKNDNNIQDNKEVFGTQSTRICCHECRRPLGKGEGTPDPENKELPICLECYRKRKDRKA